VQSERDAARQRLVEDQERYAQFAGRAVRAELEALQPSWEALVPRSVGWESRLEEVRAALDAARGQVFVRDCHLLHVSGRRLYPVHDSADEPLEAEQLVPDAAEAERIRGLLSAGEAAEFDGRDPAAALRAYRGILVGTALPSLRAMAHAGIARAQLQRGDLDGAIKEYEELLRLYPNAWDLDNQPLRVEAQLGIARALESKAQPQAAAGRLTTLYSELALHSEEIGSLHYEILVERIERQMARLLPRPLPPEWQELVRSFEKARARPKKQVGTSYLVHKLSRKLLRASLEGLPYSTPLRYLSETVDGKPFLLAYLFLPNASGTAVAGLVGLEIDLNGLASALLPDILRRLEPAPDVGLAVVDGAQWVAGVPDAGAAPLATSSLGVPFGFWSVAVFRRAAVETRSVGDFRTKLYLYVVLLLLLTIMAGTGLGVAALRHQARLANLKSGLVSRVSHELRTPLTSIRLHTEMLEMGRGRTDGDARARSLGTIRRECERLQRLIDQLLDFARIERGRMQFRLEYEEMGPLVGAIAEEFRTQAESEGFRYEVSIEAGLPELRVDAEAVRQMLLNLLSNAVKYSDSVRHIVVRAFRRDAELGIQVEDHGIGLDPAEHRRIFDEFYRVDTRLSSQRGGVGLGLTLVRRLAAAHGGRVGVESERGRGSRFTVWLPLAQAPARRPGAMGGGLAEAGGG
jgi:two-component system phosphate regulon sensor histidine kinase PhoR